MDRPSPKPAGELYQPRTAAFGCCSTQCDAQQTDPVGLDAQRPPGGEEVAARKVTDLVVQHGDLACVKQSCHRAVAQRRDMSGWRAWPANSIARCACLRSPASSLTIQALKAAIWQGKSSATCARTRNDSRTSFSVTIVKGTKTCVRFARISPLRRPIREQLRDQPSVRR